MFGVLIGLSGKHKSLRRRVLEGIGIAGAGVILGSVYAVNQYLIKSYVIHEMHEEQGKSV